MEYFEKQIRSEEKYKGIIVRVRLDDAELHTGKLVKRDGVLLGGLDVPLHVGGARLLDGTGYVLVHGVKILVCRRKSSNAAGFLLKCWGAKKRRTLFWSSSYIGLW